MARPTLIGAGKSLALARKHCTWPDEIKPQRISQLGMHRNRYHHTLLRAGPCVRRGDAAGCKASLATHHVFTPQGQTAGLRRTSVGRSRLMRPESGIFSKTAAPAWMSPPAAQRRGPHRVTCVGSSGDSYAARILSVRSREKYLGTRRPPHVWSAD